MPGTRRARALLLPGWCGDRTVFDGLLARLGTGRRSVAVDLPEHGESPRTGARLRTVDVVDAAVAQVDALGIDRGRPRRPLARRVGGRRARRRLGADRVPGVVLLDWMVLGTPPGFDDALAGLQTPALARRPRRPVGMWTDGVDVPALTNTLPPWVSTATRVLAAGRP